MKDLDDELGEPFADRVSRHLAAQADQLSYGATGLDLVIARGRRRQRRARGMGVAMVALAVAGSVGAYRATRPHDLDRQKVTVGADPSPLDPSASSTTLGVLQATTVVSPAGVLAPGGSGLAQADLPQATLGGTAPSWARKEPKSSLMNTAYTNNHTVSGSDALLMALSTAPGVARDGSFGGVANTLYRSTDGIEWTPSTKPAWISQIAAAGDRVYAVGTAPAEAAAGLGVTVGAPIAGTSTDGGKTWNQVALPALANSGPKGTRMVTSMARITAGAKGVVVTVSGGRVAYVADLVPSGVDTSWGVTTSPAGVSVLGRPPGGRPSDSVCPNSQVLKPLSEVPAGYLPGDPSLFGLAPWVCAAPSDTTGITPLRLDQLGYPVAHTYTWSELGTTWERLMAPSQDAAVLYSPDGASYSTAGAPWSGSSNGFSFPPTIVADGDGFLAVTTPYSAVATESQTLQSVVTYTSTDGTTWTAGTPVAGVNPGVNEPPGRLADGRWAMVGYGGAGDALLLTSADGLAWQAVGLDDVVRSVGGPATSGSVDHAAVGPHGITMSVMSNTDPVAAAGGAHVTKSGVTLTVTDQRGSVSVRDDATGAVLGAGGMWSGRLDGALRIEQGSMAGPLATSAPATTAVENGGAVVPSTVVSPAPANCEACGNRGQPVEPQLVVLDPVTGAERVRFTNQELNAAIEQQVYNAKTSAAGYDLRAFVLTSADGATWAATDLSEVAGEPISMVAGIDHLGDKVVVRAQTKRVVGGSPNTMQLFAQLALVATFG